MFYLGFEMSETKWRDKIGILQMKFIIGRTHVYSQIINTYKD